MEYLLKIEYYSQFDDIIKNISNIDSKFIAFSS